MDRRSGFSRTATHGMVMLALASAMIACQAAGALPAQAPTASATAASTATIAPPVGTPAQPFEVRAMAYNIWLGGGMQAGHSERGDNMNRLDDLIKVVQEANPDILGLEEANGWMAGSPSIIDQFASALHMHAYLAPTWRDFNLALLSKYPILETENLSDYVGNNGALRAVVEVAPGRRLNVVVVHLDPSDLQLRTCEFDKLRRIMEKHSDDPGILMGDFNTAPHASDEEYLAQGGWELARSAGIDNIVVRSRQSWSKEAICFTFGASDQECVGDRRISDHMPVGAVISFHEAPNAKNTTAAPTPLPVDKCRYDTAPAQTPNDAFDGPSLDQDKWQNISSGEVVQQAGRVSMTTRAAEPSSNTMLRSRWQLRGDFDVQIDFEIDKDWKAPATDHLDGAMFGVSIDGVSYHITRLLRTGGGSNANVLFSWSTNDSLHKELPTAAQAGKYRLVRTGTMLSLQYDTGGGWQELAQAAVGAGDATVYFGNGSVNASEQFTTYFDNFLINSGSAVY